MLQEKSSACGKERSRFSGPPSCLGFPAMHLTLPRNATFLIQRARDPISGFKDACDAPWKAICESCVEAKRLEWRKERTRIWEKLDELFELRDGTSGTIFSFNFVIAHSSLELATVDGSDRKGECLISSSCSRSLMVFICRSMKTKLVVKSEQLFALPRAIASHQRDQTALIFWALSYGLSRPNMLHKLY